MNLRKSVFSGSWYPSDRQACEAQIQQFLDAGKNQPVSPADPIGGIVPHAGWYYSGSVACNVIRRLARAASPDVVVIFGMHLHPHSAACIMTEGAWDTPFGPSPSTGTWPVICPADLPFNVKPPPASRKTTPSNFRCRSSGIFSRKPGSCRSVCRRRPKPWRSPSSGGNNPGSGPDHGCLGSTDLTHYGPNYGFTPQGAGRGALTGCVMKTTGG